jgi:HD-like signal output (HDOD) protein
MAEIPIAPLAGVAALGVGFGAWAVLRRNRVPAGTQDGNTSRADASPPSPSPPLPSSGARRVDAVNSIMAQRLWRIAFAAPNVAARLEPAQVQIRDAVTHELKAGNFDPSYFPRRPALMPQLMRTVNDADARPDAIADILAQDPVLAGDVLRLANSNYYRIAREPVETIQRAVVICGMGGLQKLLAVALLQPVFRATDKNFPRFPPLLWVRTERAALAAELYAAEIRRQDRFEAQMLALLSALGPLVVYRATVAAYAHAPGLPPSADLCVTLIGSLGQQTAQSIARQWESSPRLVEALRISGPDPEQAPDQALALALFSGELIGTLSLLESQRDISPSLRQRLTEKAGLPEESTASIWDRLTTPRD